MLPIKKEYTKDIVDEKWNTVAVLKYDQASMYEWYKFVESEYMNLELLKIINKWIEWKLYKNRRMLKEEKVLLLLLVEIQYE